MEKTAYKSNSTDGLETVPDSRRDFLAKLGKGALLASLGVFGAGCEAVDRGLLGRGLTPIALVEAREAGLPKSDMLVHSQNPFNGEFAPHLLSDDVTPAVRHFVRNNSGIPERAVRRDLGGWKLVIDGEVHKELVLSMDDLTRFPQVTMEVVLECAGNGRSLFSPQVSGTPWQRGAVACSEWTGVRLRDVLQAAGLKPTAVYTGNYGGDIPNDGGEPFSRGIPIEKAMDEHTLIALKVKYPRLKSGACERAFSSSKPVVATDFSFHRGWYPSECACGIRKDPRPRRAQAALCNIFSAALWSRSSFNPHDLQWNTR